MKKVSLLLLVCIISHVQGSQRTGHLFSKKHDENNRILQNTIDGYYRNYVKSGEFVYKFLKNQKFILLNYIDALATQLEKALKNNDPDMYKLRNDFDEIQRVCVRNFGWTSLKPTVAKTIIDNIERYGRIVPFSLSTQFTMYEIDPDLVESLHPELKNEVGGAPLYYVTTKQQ